MPTHDDLPDPDALWRLDGASGVAPSRRAYPQAGGDPSPRPYIVPSAAMAEASPRRAARVPAAGPSGLTWLLILAVLGAGTYAVMSSPWLYGPAVAITTFMSSGPSFPGALVYLALASIPVTLVHELGHAIAARRLLGVAVDLTVGATGRIAKLRLGEISVSVNAFASPARVAGRATFDASRARARDIVLIALAGPAASAAGVVVTLALLRAIPAGGVAHHLVWAVTLGGVFGVVLNLIPFAYEERRGGPRLQTDGRLALQALRSMRSLR